VTGFEMLARWVDAEGIVRSPGHFLPMAAKLDLVDGITMQVVDDLIQSIAILDAQFGADVRYSLNISPTQTTDMPFMLKLLRHLSDFGQPERFILELTEESFAATGPFQTHLLPSLRNAGIAISIDDFGTGYSSLAKLAELTVDELKLDRSLVSSIHERPRNQVILRAVESLGSALNMSIVAEGIETEEENRYLLEQTTISIGQGYFHHKPQLLTELLDRRAMPEGGRPLGSVEPVLDQPHRELALD
jgi:EAL domain-containing protein (putative c-di-GMP-specific phosphodiesterase class I)